MPYNAQGQWYYDPTLAAKKASSGTTQQPSGFVDKGLNELVGIANKYDVSVPNPEPKMGKFQRLITLLRGTETAPAAMAALEGKNPITAYLKHIGSSAQGTITGKPYEAPSYEDVLTKTFGTPTSRLGKFGVKAAGLAGDIFLDPTTYLSFGASKGPTVGGTKLLKTATPGLKDTAKEFAKWTAIDMIQKQGSKETLEALTRKLVKNPEIVAQAKAKWAAGIAQGAPEYTKFVDPGGIKLFGKSIVGDQALQKVFGKPLQAIKKQPLVSSVGRTFSRDYGLTPAHKAIKQKWLDLSSYQRGKDLDEWVNIIKKVPRADDRVKITYALEEGAFDSLPKNLQPVAKEIRAFFDKYIPIGQRAGILDNVLPNYVTHVYKNPEAQVILERMARMNPNKVSSVFKFGKQRQLSSIKEAKTLGLLPEEDIAKIGAQYLQSFNRAYGNAEYLKELTQKLGVPVQKGIAQVSDEIVPELGKLTSTLDSTKAVPLSVDEIASIEKGMGQALVEYSDPVIGKVLLPQSVVADLTKNPKLIEDESARLLLKQYDRALNFWKGSVTSLFPSFHTRNAVSNVSQNFLDIGLDSINPARHTDALKVILGSKKGKFVTDLGEEYSYKALRELAEKKGILKGNFFYTDAARAIEDELKVGMKKGIKKASLPRLGRWVGGNVEDEARLVNFLSHLRKGVDPDDAAKLTKKFLFDYNNLSKFEREVMRRLIPFYTWTRKNISLQLITLLTRPGRITSQLKTVRSFGDPVSDEERVNSLPSWAAEQAGFKYGTDKFGRPLFFTGLGLPIEAAAKVGVKDIFSMLSPAIKAPTELATGTDIFRGKPIKEVYTANEVGSMLQTVSKVTGKDLATVKKILQLKSYERPVYVNNEKTGQTETVYTMNPYILWGLRTLPTSRLMATLGYSVSPQESNFQKLLRGLTGAKAYSFDEPEQQYFREKAIRDELQNKLQREGLVGTGTYYYEK